jgi:hypothetical protein
MKRNIILLHFIIISFQGIAVNLGFGFASAKNKIKKQQECN